MAPLAEYIGENAFRVENIGYAATKLPIRELVEEIHQDLQRCCPDARRKLHFVTHSLGGILVRGYVAVYPPPNMGRVVMLSPPNKGSELADVIRDSWLAKLKRAPAVKELGTNPESVPNLLGPPPFELGVITGDRSWHPGAWLIKGKDDGVVSVESAHLDVLKDFRVVHATHTYIMRDPDVKADVVHFLRTGTFLPVDESVQPAPPGAPE